MTEEAERIKHSDRDSQHKSVLRFNMFFKKKWKTLSVTITAI